MNNEEILAKLEELNNKINEIDSIEQSFDDAMNMIYNKCVSCGITPDSKSPSSLIDAIQNIYDSGINIEGAEINLFTFIMSNEAQNQNTLELKGFTDTPNYVCVSAVNNVWMNTLYDKRANATQVKTSAYATTQTIAYENLSTRFPIFTKDKISIVPLVSGVGDKKATAIVARFTSYNEA